PEAGPSVIRVRRESVAAINPHSGRVLADRHADLSGYAPHLTGGDGAVWTYGTDAQNLYRVDAHNYDVKPIGIGITPNDLAFSGGRGWLIDGGDGRLLAVDARSPTLQTPYPAPPPTTSGASLAATPAAGRPQGANECG